MRKERLLVWRVNQKRVGNGVRVKHIEGKNKRERTNTLSKDREEKRVKRKVSSLEKVRVFM